VEEALLSPAAAELEGVDVAPLLDVDASPLLELDVHGLQRGQLLLSLDVVERIDWEAVASSHLGILDPIGQLREWLAGVLSGFVDTIRRGFEAVVSPVAGVVSSIWDTVRGIPSALADIGSALKGIVIDPIANALRWVGENFPKIPEAIGAGLKAIADFVAGLPEKVRDFVARVGGLFGELADKIKGGFAWFIEQASRLPEAAKELAGRVADVFGGLAEKVKGGFAWFVEQVGRIPGVLKDLFDRAGKIVGDLIDKIKGGLSWFVDQVAKAPKTVKDFLEGVIGNVAAGVGGLVEWVRRGFEDVGKTIGGWFAAAREWFGEATKLLFSVGAGIQGFVNAVLGLPDRLKQIFEGVLKFFEDLWKGFTEFLSDPLGWLKKHVVEPAWSALTGLGAALWEGAKRAWEAIRAGASWLWDQAQALGWEIYRAVLWLVGKAGEVLRTAAELAARALEALLAPLLKPLEAVADKVAEYMKRTAEKALKEGRGEAWFLLTMAAGTGPLFFIPALPAYALSTLPGVIKNVEAELDAAPAEVGVKAKISAALGKLASWLGEAGKDAAKYMWMSFCVGMSISAFDPVKYIIRPAAKSFFTPIMQAAYGVDAFFDRPTELQIIEWLRRCRVERFVSEVKAPNTSVTAPLKWDDAKKYGEAILRLYGLPDRYAELLTVEPDKFALNFVDRFGARRTLPLGVMYDLPTHTELARMTQRDVFPGVDIMQAVTTVRGWHPDMTTLTYLMTFKYPSFEKLWSFYMRALAGMLWFKAPDTAAKIFAEEAKAVKGGVPISPLDVQAAIKGPEQLSAFESALNAYFKWLEYGNFSWFTQQTEMYGVKVGAEIFSKLGGWTADSWLMVDVAADIPTKLDMRWMSRYGIFMHMADKLKEAGVPFEGYAPLVQAVPRLLDGQAGSSVQVDLRWFSKLLQATGLHPAWTPVVTAAENIMVIADEMTLLRTGWLNLFKEGMMKVDEADKCLAGLLTVAYQVGYWDSAAKAWTSGWLNLPVRWLPHERRLLELRMAMDRVLDVYREIYGYIRSGIRTIAIAPKDAEAKLKELVKKLDEHYADLTKGIVGKEMRLALDESYLKMWLELQGLAQDIEAYERVRIWWTRVSGWVLYRVAYGYVTDEEVKGLLAAVAKYIPLHEVERRAYEGIATALLGIARKEAVPSPSMLATIAEYLPAARLLIPEVFKAYNVTGVWQDVWRHYIYLRPVYGDVRAWASAMYRLAQQVIIAMEQLEPVFKVLSTYGWEKLEVDIVKRTVMAEAVRYAFGAALGTPRQLTAMSRYADAAADWAYTRAARMIELLPVDESTKKLLKEMWRTYIAGYQNYPEIRSYINELVASYAYGVLDDKGLDQELDYLAKLGVPAVSRSLVKRRASLRRARVLAR